MHKTLIHLAAIWQSADVVDFSVPVIGVSAQTVAQDLREFFRLSPQRKISGEVYQVGHDIEMRLRLNGAIIYVERKPLADGFDESFNRPAAEAILRRVSPYTLIATAYLRKTLRWLLSKRIMSLGIIRVRMSSRLLLALSEPISF